MHSDMASIQIILAPILAPASDITAILFAINAITIRTMAIRARHTPCLAIHDIMSPALRAVPFPIIVIHPKQSNRIGIIYSNSFASFCLCARSGSYAH